MAPKNVTIRPALLRMSPTAFSEVECPVYRGSELQDFHPTAVASFSSFSSRKEQLNYTVGSSCSVFLPRRLKNVLSNSPKSCKLHPRGPRNCSGSLAERSWTRCEKNLPGFLALRGKIYFQIKTISLCNLIKTPSDIIGLR